MRNEKFKNTNHKSLTASHKMVDHIEVKDYNKAFFISIVLNVIFVIVEVIYGIIGDSLALIADAGHNLSDVLSLVVAWSAIFFQKEDQQKNIHTG